MSIASNFYEHLCQQYPGSKSELLPEMISPQLLSPHQLTLSENTFLKIEKIIADFETLRTSPVFLEWSKEKHGELWNPKNRAVFMSYDFHLTPDDQLKLIEINTNASFLALGYEYAKMQKIKWNQEFKLSDLRSCFENELELSGQSKILNSIHITDEEPQQQKLYAEFLLYRELFKGWGLRSEIQNLKDVTAADVIYNRSTDFFLETESSQNLRELYLKQKSVVSPHPFEYQMMADKENFIHWSDDSFWEKMKLGQNITENLRNCLPKTHQLTSENTEQIWSARKNLFFKPKNSYGSKMSYRGASISKKAFDELLKVEALAQELIPPSEITRGDQNFKYDLRCYSYMGQFQGCMARLYQGQVTNLRTEGGGFATVIRGG